MYPEYIAIYAGLGVLAVIGIANLFLLTKINKAVSGSAQPKTGAPAANTIQPTVADPVSGNIVFCKKCATQFSASEHFCPKCGTPR